MTFLEAFRDLLFLRMQPLPWVSCSLRCPVLSRPKVHCPQVGSLDSPGGLTSSSQSGLAYRSRSSTVSPSRAFTSASGKSVVQTACPIPFYWRVFHHREREITMDVGGGSDFKKSDARVLLCFTLNLSAPRLLDSNSTAPSSLITMVSLKILLTVAAGVAALPEHLDPRVAPACPNASGGYSALKKIGPAATPFCSVYLGIPKTSTTKKTVTATATTSVSIKATTTTTQTVTTTITPPPV